MKRSSSPKPVTVTVSPGFAAKKVIPVKIRTEPLESVRVNSSFVIDPIHRPFDHDRRVSGEVADGCYPLAAVGLVSAAGLDWDTVVVAELAGK